MTWYHPALLNVQSDPRIHNELVRNSNFSLRLAEMEITRRKIEMLVSTSLHNKKTPVLECISHPSLHLSQVIYTHNGYTLRSAGLPGRYIASRYDSRTLKRTRWASPRPAKCRPLLPCDAISPYPSSYQFSQHNHSFRSLHPVLLCRRPEYHG